MSYRFEGQHVKGQSDEARDLARRHPTRTEAELAEFRMREQFCGCRVEYYCPIHQMAFEMALTLDEVRHRMRELVEVKRQRNEYRQATMNLLSLVSAIGVQALEDDPAVRAARRTVEFYATHHPQEIPIGKKMPGLRDG